MRPRPRARWSLNMLDAYKYFMKNKPDGYYMSLNDFSNIVSRANSYLGDMFVRDGTIDLPFYIGEITFYSYTVEPKIMPDGSIKYTAPIDWAATNVLWRQDEESKEQKILVRRIADRYFKVCYDPRFSNIKNRSIWQMRVSRTLFKRAISNGTQYIDLK